MIVDSTYWKNDINTYINKLSKINTKKITGKTFFELEKYFFHTSYSIRKLHQSGKISDNLFKKNIVINYFQPLKHINKRNWWDIEGMYDFSNPKKCSIQLKYLLEQIIHSYTFTPVLSEDVKKVEFILFHSDKERNKKTYQIRIDEYIEILKEVSNNYPSTYQMEYDEKEDDYIIKIGEL